MINLAGHSVSLFLFQFVLRKNAISYVVNEAIAEDMYNDIELKITPLVHACSETLLRYRSKCNGSIIMDGNILTDGCFEVMLSSGLGKHFGDREKQNLFRDANRIAELLIEVMDRRSNGDQGFHNGSTVVNKIDRVGGHRDDLEQLGEEQRMQDEVEKYGGIESDVKRLTPSDLPQGVKAKSSYDQRGRCYSFSHDDLGELGKITVIPVGHNQIQLASELYLSPRKTIDVRKLIFEEVVKMISNKLDR